MPSSWSSGSESLGWRSLEGRSSCATNYRISSGRWKKAGTISRYFYDSWAILEYLNTGRLAAYFRSTRGVTTWLQVMEVFYALLRDGKPESEARDLVAARQRRNLSYVDAIGYFIARKRRLQFLTRDPGFRGLPGVLVP